jgi:hypothetical protein
MSPTRRENQLILLNAAKAHLQIPRQIVNALRVEKVPDDVRRLDKVNRLDVLRDGRVIIALLVLAKVKENETIFSTRKQ